MTELSYKQEQQLFKLVSMAPIQNQDEGMAFVTLMRICRDYVESVSYPLLKDEARDQWFLERLQRYKLKFYGVI